MTFGPQDGPPPELSTTRVAGGTSARLVAVAVAGLLVGVVGFAFVNRPPPPPPADIAQATAQPTLPAAPTPSPPRTQLGGDDGLMGWLVVAQPTFDGRQPPIPYTPQPRVYQYAALMLTTGGLLRTALEPHLEDVYSASVVIVSADVGPTLEIEVGRQWSEGGLQIFESFDAWYVALKPLSRSRDGRVELLVAHVPPRLTRSNGPGPMASGYTFTVLGRRDGTRLTLDLELVWPVAAQLDAYTGPRGPGWYNRCRWDFGPQAAPPRVSNDEAGCLD